jgi:formylglycine-generating enzyme required for sulfatase activity
MKYEITQGQYTDFLNSLPSGYALARFPNQYGNRRHTIRDENLDGIYSADAPDRACNYLGWTDVSAYLDWAALRPMTELEFEKVCRGPMAPVPNEYAWGSSWTRHVDSWNGVDGSGTETANPTEANCHYYYYPDNDAIRYGPARVGVFARAGSTRVEAGSGYYGVMELSGNVYEQAVTIGNSEGRSFIGNHGDGNLQTAPATWPLSTGIGDQGGTFTHDGNRWYEFRISDRSRTIMVGGRDHDRGGRGVRSAE